MSSPPGHRSCPYKGLQPYTEADQKYFFGRTRDQGVIISNLYAASVTVFYGASGVGKSSVLLAGVVPRLREEPQDAAVVVFGSWQAEDFVPQLKSAVAKQSGVTSVDPALPLDRFLGETQRTLDLPLFLICDQFEEYFLYHPVCPASDVFESEFSRAVNSRDCQVNFMLSLREDGLSKLDRFQGRIPTMLNNMLRLNHLDKESAREAIIKPIEQYNLEVGDELKMSVEPTLVEAVLEDLATEKVPSDQAGQGLVNQKANTETAPIETPFLQVVLTRLWDEEVKQGSHVLRLETFTRLGRAANIALTHLDTTMSKLSATERSTAANILRYLVTPSGAKIALEPATLASWAELPQPEVEAVLIRLSASDLRILKTVQVPNRPSRYEIFHDVLANAILDWRARYVQDQRLEVERAKAEAQLAKQKTRSKYLRLIIAGLLLIGVVIIYLGIKAHQGRVLARARELAAYSRSQTRTDPEMGLLLAIEAVKQKQTPQSLAALKEALLESQVSAILRDKHTEAIRGVAFSPDGAYVVTASWDRTAVVWETSTGKAINVLQHEHEVNGASFSNDGRYLVTACLDGNARVWDDWRGKTPRVVATVSDGREVWTAQFSPNGQYLATGGGNGKVSVWEWQHGNTRLAELVVGASVIALPSPSPTPGTEVAPTAPDGTAAPTVTPVSAPSRIIHVFKVAFSPDGERIIIAAKDRTVQIWEWRKPSSASNPIKLRFHRDAVYDAAFGPNGDYVVTGSNDKTAAVWDWSHSTGVSQPRAVLNLLPNTVRGVGFSPDGKLVATASDDGVVRLWDWRASGKSEDKPDQTVELRGHTKIVFCLDFSRDGKYVVTGSEDQTARVWRTDRLNLKDLNKLPPDELLKLAHSRAIRELTHEEKERYLD